LSSGFCALPHQLYKGMRNIGTTQCLPGCSPETSVRADRHWKNANTTMYSGVINTKLASANFLPLTVHLLSLGAGMFGWIDTQTQAVVVVKHVHTMLHVVRHRVSESHVPSSARGRSKSSAEGTGLANTTHVQRNKKKTAHDTNETDMIAAVDELLGRENSSQSAYEAMGLASLVQ